ncbi:hypothetical protein, partial [Staphylococcus epidermidis]|uniref:hypothetical protein n=1 Tax=Staphylococcus epidermidis TaxID=1282 RepID=UPI001C930D26
LHTTPQPLQDPQTQANLQKPPQLQYPTIPQLQKQFQQFHQPFQHQTPQHTQTIIPQVVSHQEIPHILTQCTP